MSKVVKSCALLGVTALAFFLVGCASRGSDSTTQWTAPREPLSEEQLEYIRDNPNVSKIAPAHQKTVMGLGELGICPRDAMVGSICADLGALNEAEGRTVFRCTPERICARDPFPIPCGDEGC